MATTQINTEQAFREQDLEPININTWYPIWYRDQKFWFKWYVSFFEDMFLVIRSDKHHRRKGSIPGKQVYKGKTGIHQYYGKFNKCYTFKQLNVVDAFETMEKEADVFKKKTFVIACHDELTQTILEDNKLK